MLTGLRLERLALRSRAVWRGAGTVSCCIALLGAVAGCGGQSDGVNAAAAPALLTAQFVGAVVGTNEAPNSADLSGAAWRVIEVPGVSSTTIVGTPKGWLALSSMFTRGDGKAPSGYESVLYRSRDGVHWTLQMLAPVNEELDLQGMAYGAGHYVMVGAHGGGRGVIWRSSDGEHWKESPQPTTYIDLWRHVTYVHDRFIAFSFRSLGISEAGQSWRTASIDNVQPQAAAYGRGRYLVVGSGPMETSDDGYTWRPQSLDCDLPRGCITDPSGGVSQGYHSIALFAEGRFFSDELSSPDAIHWQAEPGRSPSAFVSGHFLGGAYLDSPISSWTSGGDIELLRVVRPAQAAVTARGRDQIGILEQIDPPPDTVSVEFEDGLTCQNATCVLLGGQLYLVPTPGTPPLPDRVPRGADGSPLLSRDCPVSSMLFCDDYEARTGCTCQPEAPRSPEYCGDVGQYRCAGRFTARPGEWQVDEVAQAGCSCDDVDPNQPPGFGATCGPESEPCQAPFQCLDLEPLPSVGPSIPRSVCTSECTTDADCPGWQATGFCPGPVQTRCGAASTCEPRRCE